MIYFIKKTIKVVLRTPRYFGHTTLNLVRQQLNSYHWGSFTFTDL